VGGVRRSEAGFAGLAELAVALLLLGLLLPLVGVGLDNTWRLFASLNARSVAGADGVVLLSAAEAQLQGAQPLGYCASPSGAAGDNDPAAVIEVPIGDCDRTGLGPPPPGGAADWSGYVSPLPDPSTASCATAELGPGALVAATGTCIGFFSYDGEASGSPGAGSGALSDGGPFAPPVLTYLWRCQTDCPGSGGPVGLWLTTYAPTGGYTNAGCPSADAACTDADWSAAAVTERYVGTIAAGSDPLFTYHDAGGAGLGLDQASTPPAIDAADLTTVELVDVTTDVSGAVGSTWSGSTAVALTGNVYQSSTDGNG
jgi:hypothetical protein